MSYRLIDSDGRSSRTYWPVRCRTVRGAVRSWSRPTMRRLGGPAREHRFVATFAPRDVVFSTTSPDLRIGPSSVIVRPDGRYAITAHAKEPGGAGVLDLDLLVSPAPGAYFPGGAIETGDFASGYVVPALVADATGRIRVDHVCDRYDGTQAYHDHNWGVWRGVTWEWGAARLGRFGVLYGRVQPPDSLGGSAPLFVYLVDSLGFRAVFRPQSYRLRRPNDDPGRWSSSGSAGTCGPHGCAGRRYPPTRPHDRGRRSDGYSTTPH